MELFINELSLEGQYYDRIGLERALARLAVLVDRVRRSRDQRQIYKKCDLLYTRKAFQQEPLEQGLNRIDRSARDGFLSIVLDQANPRNWEEDQVHRLEDTFTAAAVTVTGHSVAELAERRLCGRILHGALLNFTDSPTFGKDVHIHVQKNGSLSLDIPAFEALEPLEAWLRNTGEPVAFDSDSGRAPLDRQTCLIDETRFRRTSHVYKGAVVYQELRSERYFYRDTLHTSNPHLEVCDKRRWHLGIADIETGSLIKDTRIATRRLDWD